MRKIQEAMKLGKYGCQVVYSNCSEQNTYSFNPLDLELVYAFCVRGLLYLMPPGAFDFEDLRNIALSYLSQNEMSAMYALS